MSDLFYNTLLYLIVSFINIIIIVVVVLSWRNNGNRPFTPMFYIASTQRVEYTDRTGENRYK